MKKLNLFAAFSALILISLSCQKEASFGEEFITNKLRTYTEEFNSPIAGYSKDVYELRYDQEDRIAGLESTTVPGNKFVYLYPGERECTVEIYRENALVIRSKYFLNDLNFLDSAFQTNDEGDTTVMKYFYNSDKQLAALWDYNYTTATGPQLWDITEFKYDSKNRVIEENDSYSLTTYEYDPEITGPVSVAPAFLPPQPYLPTKKTYTADDESITAEYEYTFDTEGRLTREQIKISDGSTAVKSYTYW